MFSLSGAVRTEGLECIRKGCRAVAKGVDLIKKKEDNMREALSLDSSNDVLFGAELEDLSEEDPKVWESLAEEEGHNSRNLQGKTRDNTTGEVRDPGRV